MPIEVDMDYRKIVELAYNAAKRTKVGKPTPLTKKPIVVPTNESTIESQKKHAAQKARRAKRMNRKKHGR